MEENKSDILLRDDTYELIQNSENLPTMDPKIHYVLLLILDTLKDILEVIDGD